MAAATGNPAPTDRPGTARPCRVGVAGTVARVGLGLVLVGRVLAGHLASGFRPSAWALGLLGFPALLLAWQRWWTRRHPGRIHATGPVGHAANPVALAVLYLTPSYAPTLSVTSDAVLVFYGASMLLAAARGYAGCEVLAVSNWLLRRDDQMGCVVFSPLDRLEQRARR